MKVIVAVSWLGIGVLSHSQMLIAFRCRVDMKIIECIAFDMVGMLVTPTVVATKPKKPA